MNWDDLKIAMAVAKQNSVRKAAKSLDVHHTTVSRRIEAFEEQLGVRLFDRLSRGYVLTEAGEDLIRSAGRVEEEISAIEARLMGRDKRLSGDIRLAMTSTLAMHFAMPVITRFMNEYPEVSIETLISYELVDLSRREADVILRITDKPPEHLVGRRLGSYCVAAYATPEYLAEHDPTGGPEQCHWVGWDDRVELPEWVRQSPFPNVPVRGLINYDFVQGAAAKAGIGIAMMGCFVGDADPGLRRVPGSEPEVRFGIWLLTHKDLLSTARVRVFMDWIAESFQQEKDLMEGRRPRREG